MFTVCQGRCLCSSKGGKAIFCYGEVGNQDFKADVEQDFFYMECFHLRRLTIIICQICFKLEEKK